MDRPDTLPFREVAAVIAAELGIEPARLSPDTLLANDLHCDCLHRMSIACELDVHFGVELPDEDVAGWSTVLDVAKSVARLRAGTAVAA